MNEPKHSRHVFGPVPSRRLGRSLGADLVPFKTCTYDCIYCQLGPTTNLTLERKAYVPLEEVLREVRERVEGDGAAKPDYITLSGSGEPTLFRDLGSLIDAVKKWSNIPLAVLTNGSLLGVQEVAGAVDKADLVIPSLDAGDPETFLRVNRPHPELTFQAVVDGLLAFRKRHPGPLWLEVFLLAGINDSVEQVEKIAALAARLRPDRVQLNTVVRPPAEAMALPVAQEKLERLAALFEGGAEIIADQDHLFEREEFRTTRAEVLELLRRRPCRLKDIVKGLGIHPNEALKYLGELAGEGAIQGVRRNGEDFYTRAPGPGA